jgi:hypothetical protein
MTKPQRKPPIEVFKKRCEARAQKVKNGELSTTEAINGCRAAAEEYEIDPNVAQAIVAAVFDDGDKALPEIRIEAYEKLDHWRDHIDCAPKLKKREVFERAADDLYLEAQCERDPGAVQAVTDAIYSLGSYHAGLDDGDLQFIMAGAKAKAEQPSGNGRASSVAGAPVEGAPPAVSADEYGGSTTSSGKHFKLTRLNAVLMDLTAAYLVSGLIPRGGLIVIWGPPKCGKSFFAFYLMMHITRGIAYRGRQVQQGPGVYLALEGRRGFHARIEAYRREHGIDDAPFYLITERTDLIRDHKALIAAINEQIEETAPVVVCIDTLNRSLTGSESKDEDMAAYIAAADAIREAFDCAVIIVHHCGVDSTRPRGHTSLTGAADAQIAGDLAHRQEEET